MSKTVIKIENLSKLYSLGEVGTGTIAHDLNRWYARMRGKEDPYAKVGVVNDRTQKAGEREEVWALRDINLEVKQGDVLGIIGRNGAGKSTLLKILSRITTPTTGRYSIKGRMASLLEVGTGFHGDMTGRENIYMNGTIMGMRRWEIDKKLDEIVDFSGVAKYLDTPVKRYSSGMTVRLGFAIAAHLEPEILIVDEVLAVGDVEFQKKAIGKMQDVSHNDGRTVLFVSHNMAAVQNLCKTGLLLKNGTVVFAGDIERTINHYLSQGFKNQLQRNWWNDLSNAPGNNSVRILNVGITSKSSVITVNDSLVYQIEFELLNNDVNLNLSSHLYNLKGDCIFNLVTKSKVCSKGVYSGTFEIPGNILNDESYQISTMFVENRSTAIYNFTESVQFDVTDHRDDETWYGKWMGMVRPTFIEYNFDAKVL
jgi:ABC-type polysaccharide/polyol phosphate transport system, ATPase component